MERHQAKSLVKAAAAAALLAVVFRTVDWRDSFQTVLQIRFPYIGLLLLISFVMNGVSCLKWQLFLSALGTKTSLPQLMRLYLVGYFFNNFIPGSVGGDVVRGMELGRETSSPANSYGGVFLERFTGSIALVAAGLVPAILNPEIVKTRGLSFFLIFMAAALVGMVAFLLFRPLQDLFMRSLKLLPWPSAADKVGHFMNVVFYFRDKPRILTAAMFYSLLFHVMAIVNTYVACVALNIKADIIDLAVLVPMALLVSAIPLTLNAIGIMEGAFVYFLGAAGISAADALSIALVLRAKNLIMTFLGGLFFAGSPRRDAAPGGKGFRILETVPLVAVAVAVFVAVVSIPRPLPPGRKTVHFECNGIELAGDLYLPAGGHADNAVLFLHGSTPLARRHPLYSAVSKRLWQKGYAVLNMDQRGHGESQKPSSIRTARDVDFVSDARETVRALLAGRIAGPVRHVIIAGHSFGGSVALVAGLREQSVGKVVSISPGRRIRERFLDSNRDNTLVYVQKRKSSDMGLGELMPLNVVRAMLEDYDMGQMRGSAIAKPMLIIEGSRENRSDLRFTREFVASLSGPVKHTIIEDADHYYGVQAVGSGPDKRLSLVGTNFVDTMVGLIDEWARETGSQQ